jgi:hypothetical protein
MTVWIDEDVETMTGRNAVERKTPNAQPMKPRAGRQKAMGGGLWKKTR